MDDAHPKDSQTALDVAWSSVAWNSHVDYETGWGIVPDRFKEAVEQAIREPLESRLEAYETAGAHVVQVAQALEDAAFEYQRAVETGKHVAEAKAVLDKARSANGTARFYARGAFARLRELSGQPGEAS